MLGGGGCDVTKRGTKHGKTKRRATKRGAKKPKAPKPRGTDDGRDRIRIDYSGLTDLASAGRRIGRSPVVWAAIRGLALFLILTALPFLILIRGGVLLYLWWGIGTWPALSVAALATMSLLAAYAGVAGKWFGARKQLRRFIVRGTLGVAAAYLAYTLVYVASANVKSPEVRDEYRALHPLLRLASSAVILIDPASMITDASRTNEDYGQMGLPAQERSLHYRQSDGYAHALDLRTTGRSWLRNLTVHVAFRALGFRVLRHGGTGDHLHVSLPLPS
jgi:hypothetical protein